MTGVLGDQKSTFLRKEHVSKRTRFVIEAPCVCACCILASSSREWHASALEKRELKRDCHLYTPIPLPMTDLVVPLQVRTSSDEEEPLTGHQSNSAISMRTFGSGSSSQVALNMDVPQEGQHSSGNSFASLMKRPDDELFHCMVSYRVNTDAARARAIHDGLHFKALNAKKKLDLFVMAKYPAGFNRPREAKKSWLNIFLDKSCLQDSKDWADEGFLRAILKSLTIIPILSWETEKKMAANGESEIEIHKGSVGGLAAHNKDSPVDNVLLELVLAKELHCVLQAFAKASNQNDTLYPCMHIFPIFVQNLVFAKLSTLSDDAPQKTLAKASAVLRKVGIQTDDDFMKQSVKSIICLNAANTA